MRRRFLHAGDGSRTQFRQQSPDRFVLQTVDVEFTVRQYIEQFLIFPAEEVKAFKRARLSIALVFLIPLEIVSKFLAFTYNPLTGGH